MSPKGKGNLALRIGAVTATLLILGLLIYTGWREHQGEGLMTLVGRPHGIMGTRTEITVTGYPGEDAVLNRALGQASQALRNVERAMSSYLKASEISKFNAANVDAAVKLSEDTAAVLHAARALAVETNGAFDVTCRPIIELWKTAARADRPPTEAEIAEAKALCGWDKISLGVDEISKTDPSGGVDLGGIAKGYGIDKAVEAIKAAGASGGLVNVGGDVRCFGHPRGGGPWDIGLRDPFSLSPRQMGRVRLRKGAVCTSGNYERFSTIAGKRYSHIVDPRTGRPVDVAPSVTVVAPTAIVADAWATALSVLGPDGLELLGSRKDIEAMLVVGTPHDHRIVMTPGFRALLDRPIEIAPRPRSRPATGD